MKYIRTKDGRIYEHNPKVDTQDVLDWFISNYCGGKHNVVKIADTIEELCDEFVVKYGDCSYDLMQRLKWAEMEEYNARLKGNGGNIYGAIWTDKGLIYVAKMNDKGELELL